MIVGISLASAGLVTVTGALQSPFLMILIAPLITSGLFLGWKWAMATGMALIVYIAALEWFAPIIFGVQPKTLLADDVVRSSDLHGASALFAFVIILCGVRHNSRISTRLIDEFMERDIQDPLTGVLNRRGFNELISRIAEDPPHAAGALLLLDVDDFKAINDRYGHPVGDEVLLFVVEVVGEQIRQRDRVARLGGDEFAVVLGGVGEAEASGIAERISAAFRHRSFTGSNGSHCEVSVSVGLAHCEHDGPCDPEPLLQAADDALYRAKAKSGPAVAFASPHRPGSPMSGAEAN